MSNDDVLNVIFIKMKKITDFSVLYLYKSNIKMVI